jgi:hypothetical protein
MVKGNNPVLIALITYHPVCFERFCCDVLTPFFASPDTVVYNYNERCNTTYFNVAGQLVYYHVDNSALNEFVKHLQEAGTAQEDFQRSSLLAGHVTSRPSCKVTGEGTVGTSEDAPSRTASSAVQSSHHKVWFRERLHQKQAIIQTNELEISQPICEAAMWTQWEYCGDMSAASHVAFLTVDCHQFSILVEHDVALHRVGVAHAVRFCRVLNNVESSDLLTSNDVLECLFKAGEIDEHREHRVEFGTGVASRKL